MPTLSLGFLRPSGAYLLVRLEIQGQRQVASPQFQKTIFYTY